MCPGSLASAVAYRRDLAGLGRPTLIALIAISLVGGLIGARLLLSTPPATFAALTPWLLLTATLVFAGGRRVAEAVRRRVRIGVPVLIGALFVITIYGGYFGGGVGILMLGVMTLAGMTELHQMNGLKTLLTGCLNVVAAVAFAVAHEIVWRPAIVMAISAIVGGYAGGAIARRVPPARIRTLVIAIGLTMTIWFFVRP